MSELFAPTIDDEIACVEREVAIRERVYSARVKAKQMRKIEADRQILLMQCVLRRLKAIKETL